MAQVRVGLSGWNYPEWRGGFYPEGLPRKDELGYAARQFPALELNGTFYSLQKPVSFKKWALQTPKDFVFAVKGSRYITHVRCLGDPETALANFWASGVLLLGRKLGPVLWQLPPQLDVMNDDRRLRRFLDLLPRSTRAARQLAQQCDVRVVGAPELAPDEANRRIRHAVEVRNPHSLTPRLVELLRRSGVSLVFSHAGREWPYVEELTAGFVYLRLHGSPRLYQSPYRAGKLLEWARRIERWHGGGEPKDAQRITEWGFPQRKSRDVFVFFDNTGSGHAPRDAARLQQRLRGEV